MQLQQADGKELHDLAREVLVGVVAVEVIGRTPSVCEVFPHDRAVGHLLQDVPEVAQGIAQP